MTKYAAMLRGIGPGNPNMTGEKFKQFFGGLGFTGVQVVLASGNIIFESPDSDEEALAERIENALPQKLGFNRSVIIRSEAELQSLIGLDPFKGIEQSHNKAMYLLITFFRHAPTLHVKLPFTPDGKPYTLMGSTDNAVYGSVDLTSGKTPDYMAWLEKQFGKDITSRTPKTIRLILSRMSKA
ncbi:MAG TPA: DUF1697 domain-containing protein [Candidatus Saccharimonadales bacterium]|nr:DUF1697 domain-containing protein [Candidatus Saccharimonadales bacterium]